ncbi:hypothetical protein [Lentibacillus salicampi]|uniref:Uncharacterized protein n=1 Tax=Lentibacillus salicampi TaxID=175306 RepID=A0A4Y9AGB1_9BACI|nr:hypothetical protein [Lentibacillus salicampi]TFJ93421.1 hypothetical protein E4U82_07075 [Lentibacillus salicampi]
MKRKIIVSILTVMLMSSTLLVPVSFASSNDNDEEKQEDFQPQATIINVGKPIAEAGSLTNYQLGEMLDQRKKAVGWFSIISGLAAFIKPFAIPGATSSIAATLSGMGDNKLETAYNNGQNIYFAILHANGEPTGSLTKEAVVIPSSTPIRFIYQP